MKTIKELIEKIKFFYYKNLSLSKYEYRIELCEKKQANLREQMEISSTIIGFLDKETELLLEWSLLIEEGKKQLKNEIDNKKDINSLLSMIDSTVDEYRSVENERVIYTDNIKDKREQLEKEFAELDKEYNEHLEKYGE